MILLYFGKILHCRDFLDRERSFDLLYLVHDEIDILVWFQDNCIERIENLGRLKMLEYLNLAMNNIERIENTEPLEKLEKLDLTLNFIGNLTDVEVLQDNPQLKFLFLMGNPCTEFDHYRDYVIATLTKLQFLDGMPIDKTDRLIALQNLKCIRAKIVDQQVQYLTHREAEKVKNAEEIKTKSKSYDDPSLDLDTKRRNFYDSESKYNPEYRKESMRFREYLERMDEKEKNSTEEGRYGEKSKKERRSFDEKGKALNINEANVDFRYDDSDDKNLRIEIHTYKYLDTSMIDLDVQPTYLRYEVEFTL